MQTKKKSFSMQNYHIGSVCMPFSNVGTSWQFLMMSIMMKLRKRTTCSYLP